MSYARSLQAYQRVGVSGGRAERRRRSAPGSDADTGAASTASAAVETAPVETGAAAAAEAQPPVADVLVPGTFEPEAPAPGAYLPDATAPGSARRERRTAALVTAEVAVAGC